MLAGDGARHDTDADAMADHDAHAFEGFHADADVETAPDVVRLVLDVGLQCVAIGQGDEGLAGNIGEGHAAPRCEAVVCGQQHHQRIFGNHVLLQPVSVDRVADDAGLGLAGTDRAYNLRAGAFQQFYMQSRPFGQPGASRDGR